MQRQLENGNGQFFFFGLLINIPIPVFVCVLTDNLCNSLRQDITDLGRPGLQTAYKLAITSRMDRVYDCLLPSLKRY